MPKSSGAIVYSITSPRLSSLTPVTPAMVISSSPPCAVLPVHHHHMLTTQTLQDTRQDTDEFRVKYAQQLVSWRPQGW